MRRVLAIVAALTLSLPAVAAVQDGRRDDRGRPQNNSEAATPAPAPQENRAPTRGFFGRAIPNQAQPAPSQPAPAPNVAQERGRGGPNAAQVVPSQAGPQPNVAQGRGRNDANTAQIPPRQGGPAPNFVENRDRGRDFRDSDRGRDFRDSDRGRDGRDFRGGQDRGGRFFNFRGRQYTAMRAPPFRYPQGFGYQRWNRGAYLPRIFLAAPFFFDYDYLGLPPPPPGSRWVRNGPDALLVSIYDGRVLDVIYDAFY